MKKISLYTLILLPLLVFSCSNLETVKTTSINIRIPIKNIVENSSDQSFARAVGSSNTTARENDSIYELKITLNVDEQILTESAQGTTEELSDKVFTFDELPVDAVVAVSCDILKEDNLLWTGQSESIVISEGTNNVEIIMKWVGPPTPEGTIMPDYSELSFSLMSSQNTEISKLGGIYQVAPKQKITLVVKDGSGNDITSTLKSSTITLYQNGDKITVKQSPSDGAIFIPHDAAGNGYKLRITATTSGGISCDKTISINISEDIELPDGDAGEYKNSF